MGIKYLSLIFSICGILILYYFSLLSEPIIIEIDDIAEYEGEIVKVKGKVIEHYLTNYKNQIINIKNLNESITIFSEREIEIEYGDTIEVIGKVQKYNDEWEIVTENNEAIKIIQKWNNITIPLWQISENPIKYEGTNVCIEGYIESVYESYFYLSDIENKNSIIVFYNPSKYTSNFTGKKVYISGIFKYEPKSMRYLIEVTNDENHCISLTKREYL